MKQLGQVAQLPQTTSQSNNMLMIEEGAFDEVGFITIMWFDSRQAVKQFAGEDYEALRDQRTA